VTTPPLPPRHRRWWTGLLAAALVLAVAAPLSAAVPGDVDGTLPTGVVTTNLGGTYDWPYAVAVQPDGKVVVAGVSNAAGSYDFALARYNPDLGLDRSFGKDGTVITDLGGGWDWAYAVALQPDGKIVVGGVSDVTGSKSFALVRYNPNGSLDATFADGGRMTQDLRPLTGEVIHGLVIEPDGKILVAGVSYEEKVAVDPNGDFIVAQYLPDGRPDPAFGVGGVATTDFGDSAYDEAYALVRQRDGKILLGGYTFSNGGGKVGDGHGGNVVPTGVDNLALARYNPDGLPDDGFGDHGKVVVDAGTIDEEIHGLAVTPDDQIIAAGFVNGEKRGQLMLARFTSDGKLDHCFGTEGFAIMAPSRAQKLDSVTLQPDGMIVAGGQVAPGTSGDFAVVRYDPYGRPDASFGKGGLVTVDNAGKEDRIRAVAIQPDGKIIGAGPSETDFALVRLYGGR
jgi:uncharacterized delta-60 repeat protein